MQKEYQWDYSPKINWWQVSKDAIGWDCLGQGQANWKLD